MDDFGAGDVAQNAVESLINPHFCGVSENSM
jgi:hypothetical protein